MGLPQGVQIIVGSHRCLVAPRRSSGVTVRTHHPDALRHLSQDSAVPSHYLIHFQALLWQASKLCTWGALLGASRTASSAATRRILSLSSPVQVQHQEHLGKQQVGGYLCSANACSAITRLRAILKAQEHSLHLYTSKLNSVSIWTWTLTCHCLEVFSTAPSTILVPPNWTFPQKLLGPIQELAEARTITKMQSGCSPCLRWQIQPNDTAYVGALEPGTWTVALYSLVCM